MTGCLALRGFVAPLSERRGQTMDTCCSVEPQAAPDGAVPLTATFLFHRQQLEPLGRGSTQRFSYRE